MTETELWKWMMGNKHARRATATLSRDITASIFMGHDLPSRSETWPAGTRVNVVMASRFGDVGITTDMNVRNGYDYRTQCAEIECLAGDGSMIEPAGLLLDIQTREV